MKPAASWHEQIVARPVCLGDTAGMKNILFPLLVASTLPAAAPPPLMPPQTERLRCVALIAIIANDQSRGAAGWEGLPDLQDRGRHFAGVTGAELMKETGQSREQVRELIIAQVASLQNDAADEARLEADAKRCIALMDRLDPPPAPPTMRQCAGLAAIAYEEVRAREGVSATAQQLGNIAAVLNASARDELRAEGKTEAESDRIIGETREMLIAQSRANAARGLDDQFDFATCLSRANRGS